MDLKLAGKRAVVTGGSRGIGKAIARTLAEEGVAVVIAARGKGPLLETASELTAQTGSEVKGFTVDTGSDESVRELITAAVHALGGVDILVNCAARPGGQSTVPTLSGVTTEEFNDHTNVKVMGYLSCAREVSPVIAKQGWGRIINISGLASRSTGTVVGSMRNVAVSAMTWVAEQMSILQRVRSDIQKTLDSKRGRELRKRQKHAALQGVPAKRQKRDHDTVS